MAADDEADEHGPCVTQVELERNIGSLHRAEDYRKVSRSSTEQPLESGICRRLT
jgi:hypothetical protein